MQIMPQLQQLHNSLTLADGNSWSIIANDACGVGFAETLAKTMQLQPSALNNQTELILSCEQPAKNSLPLIFSKKIYSSILDKKKIACHLTPAENNDDLAFKLMELSLVFCCKSELMGGLLLHGALVEINGEGIILAGPGDVGKTTASRRLPPPWNSLSDDCTLIVLDKDGIYRAHPWPTWSTYMFGGTGGSWDVQQSIPLKAIFLLAQDEKDHAEPLGQGQATCLLTETAEQAWYILSDKFGDEKRQDLSLQRFNNICELVKNIPAFLLQITKNGLFWEEIEKALPKD